MKEDFPAVRSSWFIVISFFKRMIKNYYDYSGYKVGIFSCHCEKCKKEKIKKEKVRHILGVVLSVIFVIGDDFSRLSAVFEVGTFEYNTLERHKLGRFQLVLIASENDILT